jgi:predicted ATPase
MTNVLKLQWKTERRKGIFNTTLKYFPNINSITLKMKEKISIKNFSIINEIDMEVNKINVLIGEQASGKSLVSKLIFFFRRVVLEEMYKSLYNSKTMGDYITPLFTSFSNIFPNYFWSTTDFQIIYQYPSKGIEIKVSHKNSNLSFKLSEEIKLKFTEISSSNLKMDYIQAEKIQHKIQNIFFGCQSNSFFIPSTRSFFSIIQKNIFKLDLSDSGDEYFIKRFGMIQEYLKERTINLIGTQKFEYENILKAKYYFDGSEEWLIKDNEKVRLRDSSTGQQELVYLLLFLATLDLSEEESNFFIIEEPDAHIFPSTQKQLVDFFASIFNKSQRQNGFLITSHSPYILTCFNNLIQGQNTFDFINDKKKKMEISEQDYSALIQMLEKISSEEKRICFDDISVFLMENGKIKDIMDYENRLIDADPIDDVSEVISKEFSQLLDIKYGE